MYNAIKHMVSVALSYLTDRKLTNDDTAEILGLVLTHLHCTPNILP